MNVCEEPHWFDDDASPPADVERMTLRTLIAIVSPLCRGDETARNPDIAEDILTPAQRCNHDEKLEVERLCRVFALVLEHLGHAVLSALADYLASFESACVLKRFLESVEQLTDTLSDAYDASILDMFLIRLKKELYDEPF